MTRHPRLRVAIVGAGRVGSVLGRLLVDHGHVITAVVSRTPRSARAGGRFLKCRRAGIELSLIPENTDLVFMTVPHDAVEQVAGDLASVTQLPFRRLAVCHASGMLTAAVLAPLKRRGSVVFSFHPLQTFPRDFPPRRILPYVRGIAYGVDGPPEGIRMARRLAQALEGKVVLIPPDLRVLYHAACVAASNHLTTVLWIVQRMYESLRVRGVKFFPMFGPIVDATVANIARTSPESTLSGPIARGGTETVAAHFKALEKNLPELIPYFAAMSLETIRLAAAKGSLDSAKEEELLRLVHAFQSSEITKQENL